MRFLGLGFLVFLAFVVLVPTGPWGTAGASAVTPSAGGATNPLGAAAPAPATSPAVSTCNGPCGSGLAASSGISAKLEIASLSQAKSIPWSFWGINVAAAAPFTNTDAASIGATPVTFVRFPGGFLGEEFNYTSNVLTAINGSQTQATTNISEFVTTCRMFSCQAILQMPAEIDSPSTAAYYANYVVNKLHFQPAFWEIGNSPSGWVHYDVPWSQWATRGGGNTTPVPFANEVAAYIKAISAVDPAGRYLALGMTMWVQGSGIYYSKSWIEALASIDGKSLAGITVHSYVNSPGPSSPTWAELFSNLKGEYSLPDQINADRSYILSACPTCTHLYMYVSEINAAQLSTFDKLLTSFAGPLYEAAETTQGLNLHVSNLDWFCYDCHFQGAWEQGPGNWQKQYTLFRDVLSRLQNETLTTTVKGPWWLYASATYGTGGLSLMLVNVNGNHNASVNLAQTPLQTGVLDTEYLWQRGESKPSNATIDLSSTLEVPPHSILLLTVAPIGLKIYASEARPAGVPQTRDGTTSLSLGPMTLGVPRALLHSPASTVSASSGSSQPQAMDSRRTAIPRG